MKILAVLHPTPFCNLDCDYCWAPRRDDRARMSLGVLEQALDQVYRNPLLSRVDFCWLTGEPLVMGLDYYKSAVAACRSLRPATVDIQFLIQTNGTLITEEWADFFAANDFVVGISIDGPQHVHDGQRKTKTGKSSFSLAMRGVDILVRKGVRGGPLCVITRETLRITADELFHFFRNRGLSWSYLIEAGIGENAGSERALSHQDLPQLEQFLGRLMELWGEHPEAYIKDFDALSRRLFGSSGTIDYNSLGCLDIVNITADGSFFWGNPELMSATLGELADIRANMSTSDVWGFRKTLTFERFEAATHAGIERCKAECQYFDGCRGGNPAHKFYAHGRFDVSSHLTCELNDQVIGRLMLHKIEAAVNQ